MPDSFTRNPPMTMGQIPSSATESRATPEEHRHSEGLVARSIEEYTARAPSDTYLWAAGLSIAGSLALKACGRDHAALFVGQWVAPFLVLGVYNKIVKTQGSDRVHSS